MKFAFFYLAEYMHLVTLSAVATTLFLGGWHGPAFSFLPWLWPVVWFTLKVVAFIVMAVWVRATLPRMRYDRLMALGWRVLIPAGLLWILITGALIALPQRYSDIRTLVIVVSGTVAVVLIAGPMIAPRPAASSPEPDVSPREPVSVGDGRE
jgi:NADH-quinone oxidoreductase subunit H